MSGIAMRAAKPGMKRRLSNRMSPPPAIHYRLGKRDQSDGRAALDVETPRTEPTLTGEALKRQPVAPPKLTDRVTLPSKQMGRKASVASCDEWRRPKPISRSAAVLVLAGGNHLAVAGF